MPDLTLAICARHAQDIIGTCLESIQGQTVVPDEILVAVDEPDDPTIPVAERYGARVIVSGATGLYEARNAVLAACTTEYLAFTDADCVLVPEWVERAKQVLDDRPEVAAGTGRHPPIGVRNVAGWLHHMWYLVETRRTGYTDGVIGGNSYFRTGALREAGGWLPLGGHSAAEDVYISEALRRAGHRIWFEEGVAAQHQYETRMRGLWRKSVMMGKDIVVMMRTAGWYGRLWWYTLLIVLLPAIFLTGLVVSTRMPGPGAIISSTPLLGSLVFLSIRFGSLRTALPRWIARWILIWPYTWGILKGLATPVHRSDREPAWSEEK